MEPAEVAAAASSNGPAPALRVFCVSDIHTDYPQNMAWIHALSLSEYQHDALVLAGDVSDSLPVLEETLLALTQRFKHVFFLPGNHGARAASLRRGSSRIFRRADPPPPQSCG